MTQQIQTTKAATSLTVSEQLPMPDYKIGEAVARLSLLRVLPNGGSFNKAVAAEYLDILRGIPDFALQKAFDDYRLGRFGDPKWMPTPIELKQYAQTFVDEHNRFQRMAREEREQVEAVAKFRAGRPHRTPEEVARMVKLAEEAKENLTQKAAIDFEADQKRQAEYKRALLREQELFADSFRFGPPEKWGWSV